jgi:hypothetical protein
VWGDASHLIEVHRPECRVLEVGADGEVEEVVGAVAVAPEQVVRLGPDAPIAIINTAPHLSINVAYVRSFPITLLICDYT